MKLPKYSIPKINNKDNPENEDWVYSVNRDLTLTFSYYNEQCIIRWGMELFTKWVLNRETYTINYNDNPAWDSSGRLERCVLTDEEWAEVMDGTLGDWMDEQYTGDSRASYVSGHGLFYDTYRQQIEGYTSEKINEILRAQVPKDEW